LYKRALAALDPPSPANEELIDQIHKLLTGLEAPSNPNKTASPNKQ
jgi:hypothetical protein